MQWSDISFQPSSRTLRQFAAFWLVFFGGLAGWHLFRHENSALAFVLGALALAVGLPGLVRPHAVRLVYLGSMIAAFPLGWILSRIVLAVLFYGVFTPLALAFRFAGRDALGLRRRPERSSYWTPKPMPDEPQRYFRQF
jgi:hypothetical protein